MSFIREWYETCTKFIIATICPTCEQSRSGLYFKWQVIVDTSNEIGGDGDVPHPAIGGARRMQVPDPSMQHKVMVEAVENHMPEVVIVDEIGTEAEALACRTIAERGVMLVGTAHGQTLENIIKNPTLCDLASFHHLSCFKLW
jgi:stage III sporulation protein SpoIIIAA